MLHSGSFVITFGLPLATNVIAAAWYLQQGNKCNAWYHRRQRSQTSHCMEMNVVAEN